MYMNICDAQQNQCVRMRDDALKHKSTLHRNPNIGSFKRYKILEWFVLHHNYPQIRVGIRETVI